MHLKRILLLLLCFLQGVVAASDVQKPTLPAEGEIWISREEIRLLSRHGPAWDALIKRADRAVLAPDLSDQEDTSNVRTLAKALAYAATGEESYRRDVIDLCMAVIGTEEGARSLALGRNLGAFVLAADLVQLPEAEDRRFRAWLRACRSKPMREGRSLIEAHEDRPNNWGTHAGASRVAVAAYLKDRKDLKRCARVFKGWLGDRRSYRGFSFGDLQWQADPTRPVGVNPKGAEIRGKSVDGCLPDDQRRSGRFRWPPPRENYCYEALQGALMQAVILSRAGYDVWNWEDRALLRAFTWLHEHADFPAEGDDTWQPFLINHVYGTDFPASAPSRPGKNMGWTCWTHGP